jgi:hypothetical protein
VLELGEPPESIGALEAGALEPWLLGLESLELEAPLAPAIRVPRSVPPPPEELELCGAALPAGGVPVELDG